MRGKDGSWGDQYTADHCVVYMHKLNVEDDRGTFTIYWANDPKAAGEYRAEVDVRGPAGMNPF
jgi:hypothetical protein